MPFRTSPFPRPGKRAAACGALAAAAVTLLTSAASAAPATARAAAGPADFPASVGAHGKARVSAAVLDLDRPGHTPTVFGKSAPYDTASIVKVDILAALLLKAQDSGRSLTSDERAQTKKMIEHSDNAAANTLWRRIGLAPGLQAANKRLGLTETKGGPGGKWGLTRTTAADQIRLLRAVFDAGPATKTGSGPALSAASRACVRTLMSHVADDQSWGVSAAGRSGWALKNGWLQRDTTDLWDVNSVGRVTAGGHHYLVAVLTDGSKTMKDGVSLVERAARTAVSTTTAHAS
ncbi:serine hydrolase [Streptomyces sp. DHE7-1]|uniref:serine hydrolase n=1 Tax=unclassified Streptomyces TaxID=2593676 RepID=UPI0018EEAE76|nr:serine hydrolase [Streptomyces sp. DHE7-1]